MGKSTWLLVFFEYKASAKETYMKANFLKIASIILGIIVLGVGLYAFLSWVSDKSQGLGLLTRLILLGGIIAVLYCLHTDQFSLKAKATSYGTTITVVYIMIGLIAIALVIGVPLLIDACNMLMKGLVSIGDWLHNLGRTKP